MRIFLSYRRDDSAAHAGRLRDALADRFGAENVFQDVVAISAGEDFTVAVDRALDDSDVMLVVIGPRWIDSVDAEGAPRLHHEEDYVRFEVARALERNRRVIPVLVGNATLPAPRDLPQELRTLVNRQAVSLHDTTWHQDVAGLARSLAPEQESAPAPRARWPWIAAIIGAAAVAAVVVAIVATSGGGGDGGDTTLAEGTPLCPPTTSADWTPIEVLDPPPAIADDDDDMGLRFEVLDGAYRDAGDGTWEVVLTTTMAVLGPSGSGETVAYHSDWRYDSLAVDGIDFPVSCFRSVDGELVAVDRRGRAEVGFTVNLEPSGWLALTIDEGATVDVTAS